MAPSGYIGPIRPIVLLVPSIFVLFLLSFNKARFGHSFANPPSGDQSSR